LIEYYFDEQAEVLATGEENNEKELPLPKPRKGE
jgi:hypothetical protein